MTAPTDVEAPADPARRSRPPRVDARAEAVILLLLGGAVTRAASTGASVRYVKEGLRPFLVVAGLLLVATAVAALWYGRRPAPEPVTDQPAADDGHGHGHHEPRVGRLLLLPALALLLVAPPALGADSAGRSGSVLAGQNVPSDYPALPAGDPVRLAVLDYASRAAFDAGRSLTGRTVELTGFVTPGPDGRPLLSRIVLTCCAADGRPIKVGLTGDAPQGVAADTWLTVTGKYSTEIGRDPVNGAAVPYLSVTAWQVTRAPDQPYE